MPSVNEAHSHSECKSECEVDLPCSWLDKEKLMLALAILEKISLVALAIFAAYTSPKLFFPFFAFGVILGTYLHWGKQDKQKEGEEHSHSHHSTSGCSQGFIEQLTGVKLPAPIGLAANLAITIVHIDHHSEVFVPIIGLNAGIWIGKLFADYAPLCYRTIRDLDSQAIYASVRESLDFSACSSQIQAMKEMFSLKV